MASTTIIQRVFDVLKIVFVDRLHSIHYLCEVACSCRSARWRQQGKLLQQRLRGGSATAIHLSCHVHPEAISPANWEVAKSRKSWYRYRCDRCQCYRTYDQELSAHIMHCSSFTQQQGSLLRPLTRTTPFRPVSASQRRPRRTLQRRLVSANALEDLAQDLVQVVQTSPLVSGAVATTGETRGAPLVGMHSCC